jgi:hypothetical protein
MEDLLEAAEWLRCNEGPDGEMELCERVADWLDREIERRIERNAVRKIARETGARSSQARTALRKAQP